MGSSQESFKEIMRCLIHDLIMELEMRLMKYLAVMIAGFFVVSAEAAQNQKIQGVTLVFASDVEGQYKGEKIALSEINISKDLSQKLLKCLGENDIKKCQSLIDSDIDLRRHSLTLFRSAKNYQIKRFVSADRISVRPVPRTDQAFDFYLGEKSYTKLVSDQDIPRGHATMKDFLENLANMDDVKEAFNEQNSSRLILTSLGGMLHENRISIRGISDLTVDEALKQHYNRFPFNVHLEVEKAHNITPKASGGSSSSVNSNEAAPPPYDEQDKKTSANVAPSSSSSSASNAGAPKGGVSNLRKFWEQQNK